jgi:cysteine-rich repeat protein
MRYLVIFPVLAFVTLQARAEVRLFLAAPGEQLAAPASGSTTLQLAAGTTRTVALWIVDSTQSQNLVTYQAFVYWEADPQPGATGSVSYVDVPFHRCEFLNETESYAPCEPGPLACGGVPSDCYATAGGTMSCDVTRSDYVFEETTFGWPVFNETAPPDPVPGIGIIGLSDDLNNGVMVTGTRYLAQLDITASAEASGQHVMNIVPSGGPPNTGTGFTAEGIAEFSIDTLQPLLITITECGDGIIEHPEQCDDAGPSVLCNANCTFSLCGDGLHNPMTEQCDDGNATACDGCSDCNVDNACGDGVIGACEGCDDAGESSTCNSNCTVAACGDNIINASAGEQCDDGNDVSCDGCSTICQIDTVCGNGVLEACEGCEFDADCGGTATCTNCQCVGPPVRLFMSADGSQHAAPLSGDTPFFMQPGSTRTVTLWIDDTIQAQSLYAAQIFVEWTASPEPGATGIITYVDTPNELCDGSSSTPYAPCQPLDPSACGGEPLLCEPATGSSLFADIDREDFALAGTPMQWPIYNETSPPPLAGAGFGTIIAADTFSDAITIDGLRYLLEFKMTASGNAAGEHVLRVIPGGQPPNGGTSMTTESLVEFVVDETQPLRIVIDGCADDLAVCCDAVPEDGIRDDPCAWCDCEAGSCATQPIPFGDVGGAFGECMPDQFANVHDRTHILNCFSSTTTCHPLNMDVAGSFGSCVVDGFCNIHDVTHTLKAFDGTTTCACGPAPEAPAPPLPPIGTTRLTVVASPTTANPGDIISARVFLSSKPVALHGYQLEVAASGGHRGQLTLTDILIEERRDAVFGDAPRFEAFNVTSQQLLNGLELDRAPDNGPYLATFRFRATDLAAGVFTIDLATDIANGDQSFLIGPDGREIEILGVTPAIVRVDRTSPRKRSTR